MITPFQASQLKIDRATRHLQEFETEIDQFLGRDAISVICEAAPEVPGMASLTIRIKEEVPLNLSAILGDIVHNLRSSLDLLACDLVRLTSPSPNVKGVYYPFCETKDGLADMIDRRKLRKTGKAVIAAIEATAPYKNGNDGLRAIHDLDVLDKHVALVPVLSIASIPESTVFFGGALNHIPKWDMQITHDGQRMVHIPIDWTHPIGSKIPATFEFVFGEGSFFHGRPILDQLNRCVIGVQNTLEMFKGVISNMPPSSRV